MRHTRATGAAVLCLTLAVAGCSAGDSSADGSSTPGSVSSAQGSESGSSPGATAGPSASGSPGASADPGATASGPASARLAIETGWGPSRREITRARRLVSGLALRELAGQVIVAKYDGTKAPSALVNGLHLGGVIAFSDNITGTTQIRRSNQTLQRSAAHAGRRWPVFVGVDQEGGIVERVKGDATRFPTFMTAGAADDTGLTRAAYAASGAELVDLGFTVDFAPDGDVTSGPDDPTIGSRSAGSRPRLVARQMNAAVDGYLSAGILPVIKHFPGHGSVPADSHLELPVQDKSLRQLLRSDLVPFKAGVAEGISAVMVAHIDVRAVDPGMPSSLSSKVITGLLRNRLGFNGLVVTDALNMKGVTDRFGSAASAVRALRAGADVLLMPPSPRAARNGIVRAVRSGRLARARLEQAAVRQVAILLHQRGVQPSVRKPPGSSGAVSRKLSAAGITVASGPCRGRLVGSGVRAVGPADAVAQFNAAASAAGLRTSSGTSLALIGYRGSPRTADIVVSMDTPYVLGRSRAGTAKIASYGDTPGAMRALVAVLLGKAHAPGRLPVPVSGVGRTGC
ncbi:MAG TPA: glycoside hydrolase family 3 N-terminal domain-containing protein [Marmoricola sp.]|nr:glycoside hydrolase family 3 N-terminal domain-containing protein [Marmoricola sp.]